MEDPRFEGRDGGVILLGPEHAGMQSAFGGPLIGWRPANGAEGIVNPRGWAVIRVVEWKRGPDGEIQILYDQPKLIEAPGVFVVAFYRGADGVQRIFLVRNWRQTARDRLISDAGGDFIAQIDQEGRWGQLVQSLGEEIWQVPMGLVPTVQTGEEATSAERIDAVVRAVARRELREETGLVADEIRILGRISANPTFFPYAQWGAAARVIDRGAPQPEAFEHITGGRFFTPEEIRDLVRQGELRCSLSQAALAQAGVQLGDLPDW